MKRLLPLLLVLLLLLPAVMADDDVSLFAPGAGAPCSS